MGILCPDGCKSNQSHLSEREVGDGDAPPMLLRCLYPAIKRQMVSFLPLLRRVALCSLYTGNDFWDRFKIAVKATEGSGKSRVTKCSYHFEGFLASGQLESVCGRDDSSSPLSIHSEYYVSQFLALPHTVNSQYLRIAHFHMYSRRVPRPLGVPLRIVSEWPSDSDSSRFLEPLFTQVDGAIRTRGFDPPDSTTHLDLLNLDIFCSTSHYSLTSVGPFDSQSEIPIDFAPIHNDPELPWSINKQRSIVKSIGEALQTHIRKHNPFLDTVRWYPSIEAPPCACCGSLPPS